MRAHDRHERVRRIAREREVALEHGADERQRVGRARRGRFHLAGDLGCEPEQLHRALVAVGAAPVIAAPGAIVAALRDAEVEDRAKRALEREVALAHGESVGDLAGVVGLALAARAVADAKSRDDEERTVKVRPHRSASE